MLSMLLGTLGLEKLADRPVAGFFTTQLSHAPWVGFHFEDLILPSLSVHYRRVDGHLRR